MADEERIKQDFKGHLSKTIKIAHDPQYCYACGRSIVGVRIVREIMTSDTRWVFRFCQPDHCKETDLEIPDEAFKTITSSFASSSEGDSDV